MAIDPVLQELFDTTVTIAKRTSVHTSGYTKPGYGSATTYAAKIERSEDTVRTEQGHEVVARRKVFLYSTTAWSNAANIPRTTDRLTLPATHGPPTQPQIMMVQIVSDENGINHIVLWC
jgi:hypothetical protein